MSTASDGARLASDAAQAVLDAAGLDPDEIRMALIFLCGYSPDGVRAAVASVLRLRQYRESADPAQDDGRRGG